MLDDHASAAGRPTNPVLPGFYPDPSACRVDGDDGTWFYAVNSSFEYLPGLPIHRSRDLVTWELVGHAIHRPGQLDLSRVRDSDGLFAPTIRHDGSRFLIVCTLVGDAPRQGNFVVTANDAAGPWSDPVWWDGGGIDPSLFFDDDGSVWAHGTRLAAEPEWDQQTEVWVRELDPATLQLRGDEHVVWSGAVRGAVWAEGPHLYRRDGHVYLLASEGGTSVHHALSVARADSPTGPFVGCPGNPVFTHRHLGRHYPVINVGHADLLEDPNGEWWAVLLASRPVDGVDVLGRETFLVPVSWEDGWPVFAPGVGTLVSDPPVPQLPRAVAVNHANPLLAVRRYPHEIGDISGDAMRLTAAGGLDSRQPAFVARRLTSIDSTVQVTIDDLPDTASAALAVRFDSGLWGEAVVSRDPQGTRLSVVVCDGAGPRILTESIVEGPAVGVIQLQIDGLVARAAWLSDGGGFHDMGSFSLALMGAGVSGGFVGVTYGLHCAGTGTVTARGLGAVARTTEPWRGPGLAVAGAR